MKITTASDAILLKLPDKEGALRGWEGGKHSTFCYKNQT